MKFLVQRTDSELYLRKEGWTPRRHEAWVFEDGLQALCLLSLNHGDEARLIICRDEELRVSMQ